MFLLAIFHHLPHSSYFIITYLHDSSPALHISQLPWNPFWVRPAVGFCFTQVASGREPRPNASRSETEENTAGRWNGGGNRARCDTAGAQRDGAMQFSCADAISWEELKYLVFVFKECKTRTSPWQDKNIILDNLLLTLLLAPSFLLSRSSCRPALSDVRSPSKNTGDNSSTFIKIVSSEGEESWLSWFMFNTYLPESRIKHSRFKILSCSRNWAFQVLLGCWWLSLLSIADDFWRALSFNSCHPHHTGTLEMWGLDQKVGNHKSFLFSQKIGKSTKTGWVFDGFCMSCFYFGLSKEFLWSVHVCTEHVWEPPTLREPADGKSLGFSPVVDRLTRLEIRVSWCNIWNFDIWHMPLFWQLKHQSLFHSSFQGLFWTMVSSKHFFPVQLRHKYHVPFPWLVVLADIATAALDGTAGPLERSLLGGPQLTVQSLDWA